MTEEKGIGSKILGLFVEREEGQDEAVSSAEGREKTPAEIVAELASGAAPGTGRTVAPPGASPGQEAPPSPHLRLDRVTARASVPTDFDAIFREAGMDGGELDRVKKAEELLRALPEATPIAVRKQIVEASLKAFGFEVEKIASAAQGQRRALDAYVKVNETATAKATQDAEAQIRSYTEKIAQLRADIERRSLGLAELRALAQERKVQVEKVLEFFHVEPGGMASR